MPTCTHACLLLPIPIRTHLSPTHTPTTVSGRASNRGAQHRPEPWAGEGWRAGWPPHLVARPLRAGGRVTRCRTGGGRAACAATTEASSGAARACSGAVEVEVVVELWLRARRGERSCRRARGWSPRLLWRVGAAALLCDAAGKKKRVARFEQWRSSRSAPRRRKGPNHISRSPALALT
jgi:hypothetical protein